MSSKKHVTDWKAVCIGCDTEMYFQYQCRAKRFKYCSVSCYNEHRKTREIRNQYGVRRAWTPEDDAILRRIYLTTVGVDEMCSTLNRSIFDIRTRAKRLGIKRPDSVRYEMYQAKGRENKGNKRPDLSVRNSQNLLIGNANPFFGKKHTAKTRKKLSAAAKVRSKNPEYHRKRMSSLKTSGKKGARQCPNDYELKLVSLLDELFPGEYRFVGDWSFLIEGCNPDFVNVNGQKKVIELFGEIYHDPKCSPWKIQPNRTVSGRKKLFGKYGYQTLVVWCKELKNENRLRSKLKAFHADRCN